MSSATKIVRWQGHTAPDEIQLRRILGQEGLQPYRWSNSPGDVYSAHAHHYFKVLYVVEGSITFGFPGSVNTVELRAGDRLELPAGISHTAVVGTQGVVCLEAHK
jgi:quercetin dioxygenase-like cupin family protein